MRKMALLVLLLILLGHAPAVGATTSTTYVKLSAVGSVSTTTGKGGCISTTASFTGWDIHQGSLSGPRAYDVSDFDSPPAVYIAVSQVNTCTGVTLISGSAVTSVVANEITNSGTDLRRVSIQASFSLQNEIDGSSVAVSLRAMLTGSGELTQVANEPSSDPLPAGTNEFLSSAQRSAAGTASLTLDGKRLPTARTTDATLYLATYRIWS